MGTTDKPNVMLGMSCKFLGATLNVGYTKAGETQRFFIREDHLVANEAITIKTIIADINKLFGKANVKEEELAEKIKANLTPFEKKDSPFQVENIKFKLTTVYLDVTKPDKKDSTVDYAFRLDVDMTDFITDNITVIDIDRLTIAVWNTTSDEVKKQLNLIELGANTK